MKPRTRAVADRLKELGVDPVAGMARIAMTAELSGNLALAGRMYSELTEYTAPKLKQIEHTLDEETLSLLDPAARRARINNLLAQRGLPPLEGSYVRVIPEPEPAVSGSSASATS